MSDPQIDDSVGLETSKHSDSDDNNQNSTPAGRQTPSVDDDEDDNLNQFKDQTIHDQQTAEPDENKDTINNDINDNNDRTDTHGNNEHDHNEAIRNTRAWKLHVLISKYPCSCCCLFFFLFVLTLIIVISVPNLINFSTAVPFYIRGNLATTLKDALAAGKEDANWERNANNDILLQQETDAGVQLKLLFLSNNGKTLIKEKYLKLVDEIENVIKDTNGYNKYCKRLYTNTDYTCSRQISVTNFFAENYFIPSINQQYTLNPSLYNLVNFLAPSYAIDGTVDITDEDKDYSDNNLDIITSYWAGYGQGSPLNGTYGEYVRKYYNDDPMPAKFYYQNALNGEINNFSIANLFGAIVDKGFGYETPLDTTVEAALTIFSFGLPLDGYTSDTIDTQEQQSEIGEWCYNELHSVFTEWKELHEKDFTFYWTCSDMSSYYIQDLLIQDGLFLLATFLSVYILMIYNTSSVWLGSMGMLMIFLNFLPSILLYRYISSLQYFGTLLVMAMFIILSIGADDIFVICDTWAQIRLLTDVPMDKRLTATLKHAGKVMATTSLSTIFSFIGNTTSVFPAVYTFGAFAAWLVFVNYCSVVLFYPTVLAVHDYYFYTPNLKRGCCVTKKCANNGCCKRCCFKDNIKDDIHQQKQRSIDKFFEFTFHPFIHKRRRICIGIFFFIFLGFFYLATQLQPDPDVPQFFPDDNNYQEYTSAVSENFASETAYQLNTQIVWGIDGIDRTGTDPTVTEDIGTVIYSKNISFVSEDEQLYIAQFCDDLLCRYSSDYECRYSSETYEGLLISDPEVYGGYPSKVVKCFMTEFRDWVLTDSSAKPNTTDIEEILQDYNLTNQIVISAFDDCVFGVFPVQNEACFGLLFGIIWLNDNLPTSNPDYQAGLTNYDYWKENIWASPIQHPNTTGPFANINLRFITINILCDAYATTQFQDGIDLFDNWQDFVANWRDNAEGHISEDFYGNKFVETPSTLTSIMAASGIFAYYFIQKQIIREAFSGILLSLFLALIILTIATGNWIMAAYSVWVIFCIVICVMGFTTIMQWKLGVIEAVIYVMVVGMSVDYVVHLSEAYLSSGEYHRKDRSRRMLGIVAGSVVSGAVSTLLGIMWLFLATIVIFFKFGAFIFFLIAVSVTFSLFGFTAAMTTFGPEGSSGNVMLLLKRCTKCCKNDNRRSKQDNAVSHIEMR